MTEYTLSVPCLFGLEGIAGDELRRLDILHHPVVFSRELALAPEQVEAPPPGRRSVPGSAVWVPATAGMLLAQHVILSLTGAAPRT